VRKVYAAARDPEALRALRDKRLVSLRLDVTDANQSRGRRGGLGRRLVFTTPARGACYRIVDSTVLDQARREMEVNYFGPLQRLQRLRRRWPGTRGCARQHRLGSGLTNVPFMADLQRSKGRAPFADPGPRASSRGAGTSVFGVYAGAR